LRQVSIYLLDKSKKKIRLINLKKIP
jgi:hypothetical protein